MDDRELEALLTDLESDRVERKASASDGRKIRESICALANDLPNHRRPGVIFIGANDDGSCANLPITDRLLINLTQPRSDGSILPLPTLIVQKRIVNGCELAAIIVEPADAPPVRYQGRTYVRVGPTTRIASVEEERRLAEKRRAKDLPFDLRPITIATLADLDIDLFQRTYLPSSLAVDILEENQRSVEHQLTSLRFASVDQLYPTVLGILIVGKAPRQFFPGAYVQFLRLDGETLTDPIKDNKEIDGPLPQLLHMLDDTFQAHISVASNITGQPLEIRQPDYPIVALQQLARNAILHRTYEGTNAPVRISWFNDRIEIQSPGGPFGQVTRQNFGQPGVTDYRNPYLAEAMKNLGYVQRFGIGIQLAQKELEKNGNSLLEFTVEDTNILAIVRRRA